MNNPRSPIAKARMAARSELTLRIVSSAVLAPLALALAYLGGWPFFAFWALAACGIYWEWRGVMLDPSPVPKGLGECAIAVAGVNATVGRPGAAAVFLGLGIVMEAVVATSNALRIW